MLKGKQIELRPVSTNDLDRIFLWTNDEALPILGSDSNSTLQNNKPKEAIQAQYEENLTSHNLWEHGNVFHGFDEDVKRRL